MVIAEHTEKHCLCVVAVPVSGLKGVRVCSCSEVLLAGKGRLFQQLGQKEEV